MPTNIINSNINLLGPVPEESGQAVPFKPAGFPIAIGTGVYEIHLQMFNF